MLEYDVLIAPLVLSLSCVGGANLAPSDKPAANQLVQSVFDFGKRFRPCSLVICWIDVPIICQSLDEQSLFVPELYVMCGLGLVCVLE